MAQPHLQTWGAGTHDRGRNVTASPTTPLPAAEDSLLALLLKLPGLHSLRLRLLAATLEVFKKRVDVARRDMV